MKVDFTKIKLLDVNGEEAKPDGLPFHKVIAEKIFYYVSNLDLVEVARQINKGEVVELSKTDLKQIRACVLSEKAGLFAFAQEAFTNFLDNLKKENSDGT